MAMNPASVYDTATIKTYDNEVLAIKFENDLNTALDLNQFTTVNNELAADPGMTYKVRTYFATGSAEDVEMGEGSTQFIGSDFTETDYTVKVTQAAVKYYDEQAMNDPNAVDKAIARLSASFTNDLNEKIIAELKKGTQVKYSFDHSFEGVIDALAMFPDDEAIKAEGKFLLMNKLDSAKLIKKAKDQLQYVEDYVRTGYLGTIAGVNIYNSKLVDEGESFLGTREAVTTFVKRGVKLTPEYDADHRENRLTGNIVRLVALTDNSKVVRLVTAAEA